MHSVETVVQTWRRVEHASLRLLHDRLEALVNSVPLQLVKFDVVWWCLPYWKSISREMASPAVRS